MMRATKTRTIRIRVLRTGGALRSLCGRSPWAEIQIDDGTPIRLRPCDKLDIEHTVTFGETSGAVS